MRWTVQSAATELLAAADEGRARASFESEWPGFDEGNAYTVQDEALRLRLERGETLVGVKLGVTSRAKQRQVGVSTPNVAWLTDAMVLGSGLPVPVDELIHPRVEPEIAFVLADGLSGPGINAGSAMRAVGSVHAALEVIDSRYSGYQFTLPDVTADNGSSGRFVLGSKPVDPQGLDLALEGCLLEVDGEVVDSASGAAVLGHPAEALAFAANSLAARGHEMQPGWIVLTGGMTDAIPLDGVLSVGAQFTHLGAVIVRAT